VKEYVMERTNASANKRMHESVGLHSAIGKYLELLLYGGSKAKSGLSPEVKVSLPCHALNCSMDCCM